MIPKSTSRFATAFAALLSTAAMAQAHPGHFGHVDFSVANSGDYSAAMITLGIVVAFWGSCRLASR